MNNEKKRKTIPERIYRNLKGKQENCSWMNLQDSTARVTGARPILDENDPHWPFSTYRFDQGCPRMHIGKGPRPLRCFGPVSGVLPRTRRFYLRHRLFAHMTDSVVSSAPETQFPCPFEDKDVWLNIGNIQVNFKWRCWTHSSKIRYVYISKKQNYFRNKDILEVNFAYLVQ